MGHVMFIMLAGVGGRAWKQVHPFGFFSGRRVGLLFVCVCLGSVIGKVTDVGVVIRQVGTKEVSTSLEKRHMVAGRVEVGL